MELELVDMVFRGVYMDLLIEELVEFFMLLKDRQTSGVPFLISVGRRKDHSNSLACQCLNVVVHPGGRLARRSAGIQESPRSG
jgi:hypothetical protein